MISSLNRSCIFTVLVLVSEKNNIWSSLYWKVEKSTFLAAILKKFWRAFCRNWRARALVESSVNMKGDAQLWLLSRFVFANKNYRFFELLSAIVVIMFLNFFSNWLGNYIVITLKTIIWVVCRRIKLSWL